MPCKSCNTHKLSLTTENNTCINIPDQEITKKHEEKTPSIRFHIYHIIGRCTAHGRIPLKDKKICYMCEQ